MAQYRGRRNPPPTDVHMQQVALEVAKLAERVAGNEQVLDTLAQNVAKMADQLSNLAATTQVMSSASTNAAQHITNLEESIKTIDDMRYSILHEKEIAHAKIETQIAAHDSRLAILETQSATLMNITKTSQDRGFVLSNNAVGWIVAAITIILMLWTILAQHWKP